jgi:hypothetical protein
MARIQAPAARGKQKMNERDSFGLAPGMTTANDYWRKRAANGVRAKANSGACGRAPAAVPRTHALKGGKVAGVKIQGK